MTLCRPPSLTYYLNGPLALGLLHTIPELGVVDKMFNKVRHVDDFSSFLQESFNFVSVKFSIPPKKIETLIHFYVKKKLEMNTRRQCNAKML